MVFPYKETVKNSWYIVWQHKIFWLLAVFIAEISLFVSTDYQGLEKDLQQLTATPDLFNNLSKTLLFQPGMLSIAILLLLLIVALTLFSMVCKVGVIDGLKKVVDGGVIGFKQQVKVGMKKFTKIFWLEIWFMMPNFLLFLLFVLFALINVPAVNVIVLCLFVLYNLFIYLFKHFSYCQLVFKNEKPMTAIKSGFRILKKSPKEVVLMQLIALGFIILFGLISVLAVLLSLVPFLLLVFLTSMLLHWLVPFMVAILGLLFAVVVAFVIKGAQTSYYYTLLTKTYWFLIK